MGRFLVANRNQTCVDWFADVREDFSVKQGDQLKDRPALRQQALAALHLEIDCFQVPLRGFARIVQGRGKRVMLAPVDRHRSLGPYTSVVRAVRELVKAGGRPFEDPKFKEFFLNVERVAAYPEELIEGPLRELIQVAEERNEGVH